MSAARWAKSNWLETNALVIKRCWHTKIRANHAATFKVIGTEALVATGQLTEQVTWKATTDFIRLTLIVIPAGGSVVPAAHVPFPHRDRAIRAISEALIPST